MANLPITSNAAPSPSTGNAPSSSQKNGTANAKPAEQFGSVLARQIDNANPASPNVSTPAEGNSAPLDTKKQTTTNSDTAKIKAEQEKALAAADSSASSLPIDPTAALVAMLQLPKELKAPAVKVAADQPTAEAPTAPSVALVAMLQPPQDIQTQFAKDATSNAAITHPTGNIGKAAGNMPSTGQRAMQSDVASAASDKTDAAIIATDKLALHAEASTSSRKSVELPNSPTNTAPSAQNIAPSATSGITSNMQMISKPADNPQTISAPFGSNGWADEFSQKISWMSTQKNQIAELHLNPPDLGPLDVTLKISDNQATAMFTSPHSAVREAIENALPKLREILADNGIMLGNATVSDQTPRDGNSAGFMNQPGDAAASREISGLENEQTNSSASTLQLTPARRHHGMVDTFA